MTNKKLFALLCAFVIFFTFAFAGCGGKKVTYKETSKKGDDKIYLPGEDGSMEEYDIVTDDDGESYLVDSEGNSFVYEAQSVYAVENDTPISLMSSNDIANKNNEKANDNQPKKPEEAPKKPEEENKSPSQQEIVYENLLSKRSSGFADVNGVSSMRVQFESGGKDWLIELSKGCYAPTVIGGEIGMYTRPNTNVGYTRVDKSDEMDVSLSMWQKTSDGGANALSLSSKNNGWWLFKFANGTASDSSALIMRCSIKFQTLSMMDEFLDSLEARGFSDGDADSYRDSMRFSVEGTKVTLVW